VEETIGYEALFSAEEGMIMRRSLTIVGSYGGDLRPARSPPQKNLQKTPRRKRVPLVVRWEPQVCKERPSWIKPVVAGSMPWALRKSAAVRAPMQAVLGRHEQNGVDVDALVACVDVVRVSEFS
jgi:hypothetical protein